MVEQGINELIAETPIEAVRQLEDFFIADMWHAKDTEWKTEEDMLKYLTSHFDICKKQIKKMEVAKLLSH